jgi:MFS transporter, ACS family, pantothenate transporter
MELVWSVLTMTLASAKNFNTLVAIRFLVGTLIWILKRYGVYPSAGLAESTFYPAIQYVIGSWYKNEELAKRACIFHVCVLSHLPISIVHVY